MSDLLRVGPLAHRLSDLGLRGAGSAARIGAAGLWPGSETGRTGDGLSPREPRSLGSRPSVARLERRAGHRSFGPQRPAPEDPEGLRAGWVGPELCCCTHVRVCRQKWLENRPTLEQDSRPRCEVARRLQRRRGPCPEVRPGWPHSSSHISRGHLPQQTFSSSHDGHCCYGLIPGVQTASVEFL
ncbi:uncharacterized protein LOC132224287 [Myotis daubentonii]|uniref:uncharacterized protein LOC132224287 n=1 Tax=Myotis daubentonii TaxID=98922 RepID=UPI002872BF4C|nr:uncharacterized protein LOC132224287 [Myotis daubentonii]